MSSSTPEPAGRYVCSKEGLRVQGEAKTKSMKMPAIRQSPLEDSPSQAALPKLCCAGSRPPHIQALQTKCDFDLFLNHSKCSLGQNTERRMA